MTTATEDIIEVGTQVVMTNGAPGVIEGIAEVNRGGDPEIEGERVTVYEVEQTKDHVGAGDRVSFEGQRFLLYRSGFTLTEEFDVKVTYEFRSRVKADDKVQAIEALVRKENERIVGGELNRRRNTPATVDHPFMALGPGEWADQCNYGFPEDRCDYAANAHQQEVPSNDR